MDAAFQWGLTPSAFWALPPTERAYMLEYVHSKDKMGQFEREEAERKGKVKAMLDRVRDKLGIK